MPLSRDSKSSAPPSPKYPIEKLHAQAQYNNVADKQRKFRKQYDNQMKLYERMIREALERGDYAAGKFCFCHLYFYSIGNANEEI